ncbi:hypothetical protein Tco_0511711 [Tanacetum coccineum]
MCKSHVIKFLNCLNKIRKNKHLRKKIKPSVTGKNVKQSTETPSAHVVASESPQRPRQTKASIRQDSFVSNVEKKNQAIVDEDKGEEAKANVGSRTKRSKLAAKPHVVSWSKPELGSSKKRKNAKHEVTLQISKKKKVDCDKHTVRKGLMNKDEGVDNCLVNEKTSVKNVNERGKEMGQVKLKRNTSCLTLIIGVLDPYMESVLNVFKVDSHRVYDMLGIPMGGIPFLSLEEILGGRDPFAIDWFW